MLNFFFDKNLRLPEAFNIEPNEWLKLNSFVQALDTAVKKHSVTWTLRRIWVDEHLSDNAKCYLVFNCGRLYEIEQRKRGGE